MSRKISSCVNNLVTSGEVFTVLQPATSLKFARAAATNIGSFSTHKSPAENQSNFLSQKPTPVTLSSRNMSALGSKKTFGNPLVTPYLQPSVWTDIVGLTIQHQACNLGQGFPDYPPPEKVRQALLDATQKDVLHQYTRGYGHPRLVKAIADLYGTQFNREIDGMNEVLVTTGAYESLYCTLVSLLGPGDECIIIEPYFDCYDIMVGMAGAKPVYVPIHPPKDVSAKSGEYVRANDWKINMEELEAAFSDRTKVILINSPNNPLGKVFTRDELSQIADLCKKHDVICLSDEVYEWMVYRGQEDDLEHTRMATLPDMWERTLTISSAGKTFNTTGWKLGWTIGPDSLLKYAKGLHQNVVYTNGTMLQEAVAVGLEHELSIMGQEDSYFEWIKRELKGARDYLAAGLKEVGFEPYLPQGGYFILADYSKLPIQLPPPATPEEAKSAKDFQIVRWLIREKKLTAIPVSAFFSEEHKHIGQEFIRFCFIKNRETLEKATGILKQWKSEM